MRTRNILLILVATWILIATIQTILKPKDPYEDIRDTKMAFIAGETKELTYYKSLTEEEYDDLTGGVSSSRNLVYDYHLLNISDYVDFDIKEVYASVLNTQRGITAEYEITVKPNTVYGNYSFQVRYSFGHGMSTEIVDLDFVGVIVVPSEEYSPYNPVLSVFNAFTLVSILIVIIVHLVRNRGTPKPKIN